jgi:hypothetical protein
MSYQSGGKSVLYVLVTAASLLVMAWLDLITGQEVVFSGAYLLPVSLTAWWFSRRWAIIMSVICGITAFIVDKLDGQEYSNPAIDYWNATTCLAICLVTGLVFSRLKHTLEERKKMNEELQQTLEKLTASTAEIRKLQEGLQVVCAWTKRLKVGDVWMTPDEFLSTQLHLKLSHGISPEAFDEIVKTLPDDGVSATIPGKRNDLSATFGASRSALGEVEAR